VRITQFGVSAHKKSTYLTGSGRYIHGTIVPLWLPTPSLLVQINLTGLQPWGVANGG